ncbi:hypothetical protein [Curtobacterium sp. MCBD17_021]|uniref:hypothetical protein n=1 Tax=Curtobacterium sp. MCBD17_021 TaxID=2175665 RepID=UPI000DAAD4E6|nr:hypothetical protein [Curtobacterium sp. MCBD17_021]PZE66881.1 hypothetical protein DEI83_06115 [Curtobacterium sp. MCBD17_021]
MRAIRLVKRLAHHSIWGAGSVSTADARMSRMLRQYLPEYYLALIVFGGLGFIDGVPALRDTFGESYAQGVTLIIALAAAVAGAGEAFPARLWRIEFWAVAVLIGVVILYGFAIAFAGFIGGDLGRAAVGAIIYASAVLPRWRLQDIARDRQVHGWR